MEQSFHFSSKYFTVSGSLTMFIIVKRFCMTSGLGLLGSVGPLSVTARITFLRMVFSSSKRYMQLPSLLPILPLPSNPGTLTASPPK